jgi:putative membrane-bound dehydrogenase-like protein
MIFTGRARPQPRLLSARTLAVLLFPALFARPAAAAGDFSYLDEHSPFYARRGFPRLTTPMWFGEEGVVAAVILAIDDMRDPGKYRAYLEPIQDRLRELEGRSPLSIFTNAVDPADPRLQEWLRDGVRFDVHTRSHPCPLLKTGLEGAAREMLDCLENLCRIPGGSPVAFRMPCCDSINSASPRFFSEVLPRVTAGGQFLEADSSVVMFLEDSYRAYAPFPNYAATSEGYPYPYVIGNLLWEFPIIAPSDWQAQNVQKPFNPRTVEDFKRGIDLVVEAQGLYTFCFHPHGWIRNDQIVEVIDHAAARYGRRVRFLNFHEALERMERNLLGGLRLRAADGSENGVRLLDLNGDGFLDVVIGNGDKRETRLWDPRTARWRVLGFPFRIAGRDGAGKPSGRGVKFGRLEGRGAALIADGEERALARFDGSAWSVAPLAPLEASGFPVETARGGVDLGVRLRDLDGDGSSELLINNDHQNAVFRWVAAEGKFATLPFAFPSLASIAGAEGEDRGLRFTDADGDGRDDLVLSNDDEYYLYLFDGLERGWSRRVLHGPAGIAGALPRIASGGWDRGAWFQDRVMYVANEDTAGRPDLVEIRRFDRMLEHRETPPVSAAEALPLFRVPEGFRVELVAAEPQVLDPISIEFGADGRIWVAEMGSYPRGEGKDAGGRIRVLRDADGDGRIDESVLFAEGLSFPAGALPFDRGVLVPCAPDILYLEDTNGDGRADVRRAVFSGFGEGNQQHRVNGLHYGIDNWIYGANGDSGGKITIAARPDLPPVPIGGRDFRFRSDLGAFEAATGHTQYGLALDDFGNRFGASNSRHLMHSVLPDHYLRRNPAYAAPDPVLDIPDHGAMARVFPISSQLLSLNAIHVPNHFSSACGIAIYRGETFPEEYRGNSFVCEPVANLVHRDVLEPQGATFRARRAEKDSDFLASSDHWFRPVYAATGPDGALYLADMYRYVIEHPQYIPEDIQQILDVTAGRDRGRIWRVVYRKDPAAPRAPLAPDLEREPSARLVSLLEHPNGWWRDTAQRLLVARSATDAVPALRALFASSASPRARLHALWTLSGVAGPGEDLLARALGDPHPAVREAALRLSEPFLPTSAPLRALASGLAGDGEFRVRFQAAFTLGEVDGPEGATALETILRRDLSDRWMRAAVLSSAWRHAGHLLEQLFSGPRSPGSGGGDWPGVLEALVRTVSRRGDQAEIRGAIERAGVAERVERWHLALVAAFSEGGILPEEGEGPYVVTALARIRRRAQEIALDGEPDLAERIAAVRVLGDRIGNREDLIQALFEPRQPVELQLAVVAAAARSSRADPPAKLLAAWSRTGPAVRTEILEAFLGRPAGVEALLKAVEAGELPAREIDSASRERILRNGGPEAQARAAKLLPRETSPDRGEVVAAYRRALEGRKGEAARGREVFGKNCATCHQLEGQGFAVGPDLQETRSKGEGELLESILNPGRMVPPRYAPYVAETRDRRIATGIISSETATSITLLRASGASETILRADLENLTAAAESLMPAGLEKTIPPADMADLLAFLRDQPRLLSALTPSEVEGARQRTLREAHGGLREVVRAPERADQASWVGKVSMPLVRQLDGKGELEWRTEPVPAGLGKGTRHAFRFPAALGYRSQPAGSFTLFLGERKLLEFDVTPSAKSWKSADGAVELRYTPRAGDAEDSTGEMVLDLPASLLEPGKPATLRVTGSPSQSRRWFGLLPLR